MSGPRLAAALIGAAVLAGVGGCMEVEQTATAQKQGKYQGKPDSKPWENDPLAYGGAKWSKGDKASWETQIKQRQLAQHEHKRIYQ